MTIVAKTKILEAYQRAVALGANHDEACATVARALCLDLEVVVQVVRTTEATTA